MSDPPPARLRPAARARRAALGERYSKPSISTTASPPRAATRRPVSTACSIAWAWASEDAAKLRTPLGVTGQSATSSGRTPASTSADLEAGDRAQRAREAPQRLRLAGARRAGDDHARALAERREPLDRADGRVLGAERDAIGRPGDRQVLEAGALGDLLGRAAVDGVDADQRREALRAARGAHRAGDLVARHELAALDLRGGDVDVVVGLLVGDQAQEAGAVGEQLDGALDDAVLAIVGTGRRRDRGDGLVAVDQAAALVLVAAAATPAAAAAARALGAVIGVRIGARQAPAARRPRPRARARRLRSRATLAREDGLDEIGLAQAAEAVDPELVGEQVQIGERALLQGGAVQDGRHVS